LDVSVIGFRREIFHREQILQFYGAFDFTGLQQVREIFSRKKIRKANIPIFLLTKVSKKVF